MTKTNLFLIIVIILFCGASWKVKQYDEMMYSLSQSVIVPDNVAYGDEKLYPVTGCESDWTEMKISLYQYNNYPNDYVKIDGNFPPCRDKKYIHVIPIITTSLDPVKITDWRCDDGGTGACLCPMYQHYIDIGRLQFWDENAMNYCIDHGLVKWRNQ